MYMVPQIQCIVIIPFKAAICWLGFPVSRHPVCRHWLWLSLGSLVAPPILVMTSWSASFEGSAQQLLTDWDDSPRMLNFPVSKRESSCFHIRFTREYCLLQSPGAGTKLDVGEWKHLLRALSYNPD